MKKIYHVYIAEDGEAEGMFDENGKLLGAWALNDAHWRNEYFRQLMSNLGYEVVRSENEQFKEELRKRFN